MDDTTRELLQQLDEKIALARTWAGHIKSDLYHGEIGSADALADGLIGHLQDARKLISKMTAGHKHVSVTSVTLKDED